MNSPLSFEILINKIEVLIGSSNEFVFKNEQLAFPY